jgi:hypothetical protein
VTVSRSRFVTAGTYFFQHLWVESKGVGINPNALDAVDMEEDSGLRLEAFANHPAIQRKNTLYALKRVPRALEV